ncbi:MAG: hypothetical protein K0S53_410 [Bacteroidetes bacterium]|jgi:hypothetical protein|nr:hypothetical protein [Bacteroidota bacterium]
MKRKKHIPFKNNLLFHYDPNDIRSYNPSVSTTITDLQGSNNATAGAGISKTRLNGNGDTFRYTGSTSNIASNAFVMSSATSTITISFWCRTELHATKTQTLFYDKLAGAANDPNIHIYRGINTSDARFQYTTAGAANVTLNIPGVFTLYDNIWIHLSFIINYASDTIVIYRNGSFFSNFTISGALFPNANLAKNIGNAGAGANYLTGSTGGGIGSVQVYNASAAPETICNATLYRLRALDPDAAAFCASTNANITNATQIKAINNLCIDLKTYGLWNSLSAIYPFVGGNATAHSKNLKRQGNFNITFVGGVTHNANGITTNGTTGYGNIGGPPNALANLNGESMGLYSRTSAGVGVAGTAIDMGASSNATQRSFFSIRAATGVPDYSTTQMNDSTISDIVSTVTDGSGLHLVSRTSSTLLMRGQNGVVIGTDTNANGGTLSAINVFIGSRNVTGSPSGFCARNYAFAFYGYGLTEAQQYKLYKIVQKFQTILGRQV